MKSLHLSHTYINKSPGFSFFNPEELCWGPCPVLLIQVLNGIIRNGTVQVSKIKVRPQNFERTLQILRTCVALKWSPGFLYLLEGLLIDVPQNPDSDLFLQKGPIVLLHSSKGLSSCPPSIPGSLTSSELEIVLSELWLHIFLVLSKGAWVIQVWTPCEKGAQLSGMASVLLQTKCWGVDFWHIVEIGELLILQWFSCHWVREAVPH